MPSRVMGPLARVRGHLTFPGLIGLSASLGGWNRPYRMGVAPVNGGATAEEV